MAFAEALRVDPRAREGDAHAVARSTCTLGDSRGTRAWNLHVFYLRERNIMFVSHGAIVKSAPKHWNGSKCPIRMQVRVPDPDRRSLLRAGAHIILGGLLATVIPGTSPSIAKIREKPTDKGEEAPKIDDEKELDKYVSGLKYEEELYENPDPAEKEVYRTPRVEREPEYKKKEDEILEKESKVLKEEAREAARESEVLRQEFEKR
jgi:hypothetical protein